jgi:hypothetical protein
VLNHCSSAFSPISTNEGIELLAHGQFDHRAHGALSESTQMLLKFVLLGQQVGRWLRL